MTEHRILGLKPALRLERRSQDGLTSVETVLERPLASMRCDCLDRPVRPFSSASMYCIIGEIEPAMASNAEIEAALQNPFIRRTPTNQISAIIAPT
jgi:hypothetical protein